MVFWLSKYSLHAARENITKSFYVTIADRSLVLTDLKIEELGEGSSARTEFEESFTATLCRTTAGFGDPSPGTWWDTVHMDACAVKKRRKSVRSVTPPKVSKCLPSCRTPLSCGLPCFALTGPRL